MATSRGPGGEGACSPHSFGSFELEHQCRLPRAKPPNAMRPMSVTIRPIQRLQMIIVTIPTMTMIPPKRYATHAVSPFSRSPDTAAQYLDKDGGSPLLRKDDPR